MSVVSFLAPVGEFFTLRRAERVARGYSPSQRVVVAAHREAGDRRARAGRRASDPVAAAVLLREALLAYLRAAVAAAAENSDARPGAPPAGWAASALAELLPAVPPDVVTRADHTELVRGAIAEEDPLALDVLRRDEVARLVGAMTRALHVTRGLTESRSTTNLRGTRVGRAVGMTLLAGLIAGKAIVRYLHPDVALHKQVLMSTFYLGKPEAIVDGDVGTSYAAATQRIENSFIAVDLQRVYRVREVDVYNRVDGWIDDSLPVVVETSTDGTRWDLAGRRDQTFGSYPPWRLRIDPRPARYVRVRTLSRAFLALSEIEVYE